MNSLDGVDYDAITAAVARCRSGPYIDVVGQDDVMPLHLLHFDQEGRWASSPLIYAHRNGHGSMIVQLKNGDHRLTKYWKDPEEVNRFPTRFERGTPHQLFDFITPGPTETLQLLPKKIETGARNRLASYREHLLDVHFTRGTEKFRVAYAGEGAEPRQVSPEFEGKCWESTDAIAWCEKMIPSKRQEWELGRVNMTEMAALAGELEQHPLAFMF